MTAPSNQSLATVRLGGREYPASGSQRCGTCVSPEREAIERHLVRGWSPATIAQSLPPERALTARQIGDHFRAHLPVADEGVQRYRERAAEERGETVEEGAEQVVSALSFARRVMVEVDARLAAGDLQPQVRDGLKAAQVLADHDVDHDGDLSRDDVAEAFMRCLAAIRANCSADQVRAIGRDIGRDPLMREILARTGENLSAPVRAEA